VFLQKSETNVAACSEPPIDRSWQINVLSLKNLSKVQTEKKGNIMSHHGLARPHGMDDESMNRRSDWGLSMSKTMSYSCVIGIADSDHKGFLLENNDEQRAIEAGPD
jgi:hypothetical protein